MPQLNGPALTSLTKILNQRKMNNSRKSDAMKLKDLPIEYRPREKAMQYGFDNLSDVELLAIILRSGTRDKNVIELANDLLMKVGGLNGLLKSNYQSLIRINGIKNAKALSLASLITIFQRVDIYKDYYQELKIKDILDRLEKVVMTDKQEIMELVVLDRKKRIIKETIIGRGSGSGMTIYTREMFKEIYMNNGYAFYLIHTHPNDIAYPSRRDINFTEKLKKMSKSIGLDFLDHYIVGTDGPTSIFDFLRKN